MGEVEEGERRMGDGLPMSKARFLTTIPISTSHCPAFHCTMGGLIDMKYEIFL